MGKSASARNKKVIKIRGKSKGKEGSGLSALGFRGKKQALGSGLWTLEVGRYPSHRVITLCCDLTPLAGL